MGQCAYQAGIEYNFIDSWGLTDREIAHYYFHKKNEGSMLLNLYEKVSSDIIKKVFPESEFFYSSSDCVNYIFKRNPDIILFNAMLCLSENHIPYWIIQDTRFKKNYCLKYFISGALLFEKNELVKKPLHLPKGLPVIFAKDIKKALKKDHPFFKVWGELTV